jgi:hypothetical protein
MSNQLMRQRPRNAVDQKAVGGMFKHRPVAAVDDVVNVGEMIGVLGVLLTLKCKWLSSKTYYQCVDILGNLCNYMTSTASSSTACTYRDKDHICAF